MSTLVTRATELTIMSDAYGTLSSAPRVVAIVLLLLLLVGKELMRAYGGPRAQAGLRAMNVVVTPLLLTFALNVALRFLALVRPGYIP